MFFSFSGNFFFLNHGASQNHDYVNSHREYLIKQAFCLFVLNGGAYWSNLLESAGPCTMPTGGQKRGSCKNSMGQMNWFQGLLPGTCVVTSIIVLVFLPLLLDLRRTTLVKKGDADHLTDFTVLDPMACRIYCAELYLFSGPAADFTETHTIRSYGHSRDHQVSHPCPCYPPVKPRCNTSWAVDSYLPKRHTPTLSNISIENARSSSQCL